LSASASAVGETAVELPVAPASRFANDVEALAALATGVVVDSVAAPALVAPAAVPPLKTIGSANADSICAIRANIGSSDIHPMIGADSAKLRPARRSGETEDARPSWPRVSGPVSSMDRVM
jgi:hypothetical protein